MADPIIYTPEQCNALLPWLRIRLEELKSAAVDLRQAQGAVQGITRQARGNGHHDLSGALSAAERAAADGLARAQGLLKEINDRGIQVRDVEGGLVDFPGQMDGRPIWLCWKLGEPSVTHWHDYDKGFSSRQPL